MRAIILISVFALSSGCASAPRVRFLVGAGVGGTIGATSGVLLSPNKESTVLNGLIFGLVGGLVGGLTGLLIHDDKEVPEPPKTTATFDSDTNPQKVLSVSKEKLPEFLKARFRDVEIEELVEPDSVSEDGSLHEPHKIYRIRRPAELISKPIEQGEKK